MRTLSGSLARSRLVSHSPVEAAFADRDVLLALPVDGKAR